MTEKLRIAIVGPGRLGTALAFALKAAKFEITDIVFPQSSVSRRRAMRVAKAVGAKASTLPDASFGARVIWMCVPDAEIRRVAGELSRIRGLKSKVIFHSSGALTSDELLVLRQEGASVASVHPFTTFVGKAEPSLQGVHFAIEGDAAATKIARQIVTRLGGIPSGISNDERQKTAYHAFATFTSPLVIALLTTAEQVAIEAGLTAREARKRMIPILRQTIENYAWLGGAESFSGPLVRGDAETVSKHLQVLKKIPDAAEIYRSLARMAIHKLPLKNRTKLKQALKS